MNTERASKESDLSRLALLSILEDEKLSREELKQSEERFRRLAENARDMIYRMSLPAGKYEYVSPASYTIMGYSPEEFYQTPLLIRDAIHPDWRSYFAEQWENLLQGEMPPEYEYRFIHKSGDVRWLNQRNILVRDENGNPMAIEGIVTDITEKKEAEEALKKAEEKFSKTFRLSPDIITLTSFREGFIVDANEHAFRITGYGPDELIGRDTSGLRIWVDPDVRNQYISILQKGGSVHNLETRLRMRSGEIKTMLISGERITIGSEEYVLGVFHDITDRKMAEDLLRTTMNRLLETEEKLRRAAAQQLHDEVGQNLTALIINLNFFRNQLPGEFANRLDKRLSDSLALLEDTIDRIRDIMTDLRPSILDDYGLVAALSWSAKKFTERTHIPVSLLGKDLTTRPPLEIEYALYRLTQEALHNVMKHSEATLVEIEVKEEARLVRLSIHDDGVGFDPVRIMQKKDGKGFGLTNITERMKALGGTCEIRSEPGKGTTITLGIKFKTI